MKIKKTSILVTFMLVISIVLSACSIGGDDGESEMYKLMALYVAEMEAEKAKFPAPYIPETYKNKSIKAAYRYDYGICESAANYEAYLNYELYKDVDVYGTMAIYFFTDHTFIITQSLKVYDASGAELKDYKKEFLTVEGTYTFDWNAATKVNGRTPEGSVIADCHYGIAFGSNELKDYYYGRSDSSGYFAFVGGKLYEDRCVIGRSFSGNAMFIRIK